MSLMDEPAMAYCDTCGNAVYAENLEPYFFPDHTAIFVCQNCESALRNGVMKL